MNPPVDDAAVPATISEAERYQRLRSHLAFLRLPTATEALPAVLDEARAQDWGLVTALERLLAAEVDDTEARRLASRLRFACLPAPWRIADFDFAAQPGGGAADPRAGDATVPRHRQQSSVPRPAGGG